MNVKTKLSKALWFLLIVCGIFMIGSLQVDAAGQGQENQTDEYTIRDWRKHKDANYAEEDFWNIDVLCSSSTKSSYNVDNTMDNQTAADMKCIAEDETIHKYYVWKMIDGAQSFTLNTNDEHSSFSEMTHLFSLAGTNSGKGWKEYNNKDNNNNNIIDVNDSTSTSFKNANIQYIIVYLHRMSRGFDLYENFRTEDVYDSTISGTNYDNVKSNSKAYYLTNNNGAFRITNTLLDTRTFYHLLLPVIQSSSNISFVHLSI